MKGETRKGSEFAREETPGPCSLFVGSKMGPQDVVCLGSLLGKKPVQLLK